MSEANKKRIKWYYKPVWVVVAILAAGPFALPLVSRVLPAILEDPQHHTAAWRLAESVWTVDQSLLHTIRHWNQKEAEPSFLSNSKSHFQLVGAH